MRAYDCPQCGAAVKFQSSVTVFATCGFCRSMVVRRDVDVELMGQQATLPPDLSPLQVGTRGEFNGLGFTLVGRVRVGYHEGSWNEWCADFGGVRAAMVAAVRAGHGTMVKAVFHEFSPWGVSGVVVITESHVTIHTWPEHGYAAVDIFSCSPRLDHAVIREHLRAALGARRVRRRAFRRGHLPAC